MREFNTKRNIFITFFVSLLLVYFTFPSPLFAKTEKLSILPKYQIEINDPLHRHHSILAPAHRLWEQQWQHTYPVFSEFLREKQPELESYFPKLYDENYHMIWLDENARQEYCAEFNITEDGSITVSNIQYGNLLDGKWLYILMNDNFFVGPDIKHRFHHTSLSAGESLEAAGTFTIKNGNLIALSLSSGHYRPSVIHGRQTIEAFYRQGIDPDHLTIFYRVKKNGQSTAYESIVKDFMTLELPLFNDRADTTQKL